MQKFCTNCGTQLHENCFICPNCGALPDPDPIVEQAAAPAQPTADSVSVVEPPKASGFRWWMAAIPAVLVVAVVAALCWQSILMTVAPKVALAMAMNKTSDSVSKRYEDSPVTVLNKGAGFMENGEISVNAEARYDGETYAGEFVMGFCQEQKQISFSAAADLMGKSYAANAYLDPEFAAVSADFFNGGTFYGITFETFKEDAMESILSEYLTQTDIEEADELIQVFLDVYTMDVDTQALMEPYKAVIEEYVLDLETAKDTDEIKLDGQMYECTTLTYVLTEDDIMGLYERLLEVLEEDEDLKALICLEAFGTVTGTDMEERWNEVIDELNDAIRDLRKEADFCADLIFYVRNGRLVNIRIDAEIEVDEEVVEVRCDVNYGLKSDSDMVCKLVMECDGEKIVCEVVSSITNTYDKFQEVITVSVKTPYDETTEWELTTKWNKESGKLSLGARSSYDGEQTGSLSFTCKLEELEKGFKLSLDEDDIADIMEAMSAELPEGVTFDLLITCTENAQIEKPEYVNLDQWDATLVEELEEAINENFYEDID